MIKAKKIVLLAILVVIRGPLSALTTIGRHLAQKYTNLSHSAFARTGYLKQQARHRSTYSMPKNQVNEEAFNSSMKDELAQKYAPYLEYLSAAVGGASTAYSGIYLYDTFNTGFSLYDNYNNSLKRDSLDTTNRGGYFEENPTVFFENNRAKKFIRCDNCPFAGKDFSNKIINQGILAIKTDFSRANFEHSSIGAKNQRADFIDCSLQDTHFNHAKLRGVRFLNSIENHAVVNLKNVHFEHAELKDTHFFSTIENGQFNNSKFTHGSTISSNVRNSTFVATEFNDASIFGADVENSSFNHAIFTRAKLVFNRFNDVLMDHAKFSKVKIWYTNFSNSNLSYAYFDHSELNNTDFSQARLHHVRFQDCDALGTNFQGADLNHATFKRVNLAGADFTGADITGATFSGCDLQGTKLDMSKLNYDDWLSYKHQNDIFVE